MNGNSLVSIIMQSNNKGRYIEKSVKSIMNQTYKNWELLFVDDASSDDTLKQILDLRECDNRIRVSQCVFSRGEAVNRNSLLRDAKGRWIAFLDAGDIWVPTKLEKQVKFMEDNGYAFSYTLYDTIDANYKKTGKVISGPEHVSEKDMKRCCWLGYLTVMYDAEKTGLLQVKGLNDSNDYALWLQVAHKENCHLLPECLASQMSEKSIIHRLVTSEKWVCRYESYRKIEGMSPIVSIYMTMRNLAFTAWKWLKYVEEKKH